MPHRHPSGERLIGALLRGPHLKVMDHVYQSFSERFSEIRPAHLVIFQIIEHPPGGSRLSELAEDAKMTRQAMGELVDGLEQAGFLDRVPDPSDRRAKLVRMTPKGWEVHEAASEVVTELQDRWSALLGAERFAALRAGLVELNDALGI